MVQWYSYHTSKQVVVLVVVYWSYWASSIQIHEIRELGIKKDRPTLCAKREDVIDVKQEDGAEEVEEDSGLPSGYCTVVLDDEPVRGLFIGQNKELTDGLLTDLSHTNEAHDCKPVFQCIYRTIRRRLAIIPYLPCRQGFTFAGVRPHPWSGLS